MSNNTKPFERFIVKSSGYEKKVIGYGASTKGNVILQYCNLNSNDIKFIVDVNKDKNNKYTPGSLIKILSEKEIKNYKPDYMLVLPWHFKILFSKKKKLFKSWR